MSKLLQFFRFYMHGRSNSTASGWKRHQLSYPKPDPLQTIDLTGRVIVVTGANAGIGFECAKFLAEKGSTVYMVCRNKERAEKAKKTIIEETKSEGRVHTVIGDLSLRDDVKAVTEELKKKEEKIDAMICNAGVMMDKLTLTSEGFEVNFGVHFLFGTKLLTEELLPQLRKSQDPRVVVVTSGGMYNARLPTLEMVMGTAERYSGELQYAAAKRAQVIQCERWAQSPAFSGIKTVSVHPGWVATPGVQGWLGCASIALQPMRDLWQGSEGILWLATTPSKELVSGELYLDRSVQPKHLSSVTESSAEKIEAFWKEIEEIVPGPTS